MEIIFHPIGFVRSPYNDLKNMPRQPKGAPDVCGSIEILEEFSPGLRCLSDFSHVVVLFHFHQSRGYELEVSPAKMKDLKVGVFASRSPFRPNGIGLSIVQLLGVERNKLEIGGHDMLDGTPVLDIKPHLPDTDRDSDMRFGWLSEYRKK